MQVRAIPIALGMLAVAGCEESNTPSQPAESPSSVAAGSPPADLVLTGGRIYTLAWDDPAPDGTPATGAPWDQAGWRPDADTIAIAGDEIVFVGTATDVEKWRGPRTRVIALAGATVIPGLVDTHTHVFNLGASLGRVSLYDVESEQEAVARVVEKAKTTPAGQWIVGQGWDEGAWADRYPDKRLLTEAVPDHPVLMRSLHGFAGWSNQAALDAAGITAQTPVPSGGEIRLGPDGEPNGLLLNNAVDLIERAVPEPDESQLTDEVLTALDRMARDGYTTVHDAGLGSREMAALERLERENRLPIRVFAMLSARDEPLMRTWIGRGPDTDADSLLVTRSVKAYYDGALGSRGARLLDDYTDRVGHRGVAGDEYGFDEALVTDAMRAGFQLGIHAIGDAGNRETLDFFERVFVTYPETRAGRHRIEHAQVLHPDDLPRLAELGIVASMEPPHAVEDKTWAEQRLGSARIRGAYAWRSLLASGARLTFNADNPGSDHSIFYGLHAAVTRRDKSRQPPDGWYRNEAVTIDEGLRAYTRWSAWVGFREGETGIIAPGRWADLTVMDIDPFVLADTDPGAILDGRIVATIVAGRTRFVERN